MEEEDELWLKLKIHNGLVWTRSKIIYQDFVVKYSKRDFSVHVSKTQTQLKLWLLVCTKAFVKQAKRKIKIYFIKTKFNH